MAKKIEDIAIDSANKEYPPYYEMPDDNWKQRAGYVKGFKAGIEWARQNPEYKPMLVEYYEDDANSGQPCELCPFHDNDIYTCTSLFEEHFGGKCTRFGVRFKSNPILMMSSPSDASSQKILPLPDNIVSQQTKDSDSQPLQTL